MRGRKGASTSALVRVRYPETDHMGVVHHTHYLVWFEVGRTELMRGRGYSYAEMESDGIYMPVVEASCRYHAPARYDDEVEIETVVHAASRIKVEFAYRAVRRSDGRLLATGRTVHVATDTAGAPRRMPAGVLEKLGPIEGFSEEGA